MAISTETTSKKSKSVVVYSLEDHQFVRKALQKNHPDKPWSITQKEPRKTPINYIQPDSVVHLYTNDIEIKRPSMTTKHERGLRQKVELFSKASQGRLLKVARRSGHKIKSTTLLTYHCSPPKDGKIVKKHINQFLTELRKEYKSVAYIWALEFHRSGVPHLHLYTSICPSNFKYREWAAKTWNRIIDGSPQNLLFQGHKTNLRPWNMTSGAYLVKEYLAKVEQKIVPEKFHSVGRFWGNSRNMKPVGIVIRPDHEIPKSIFYKILRIITKKHEKQMKKWVKRNYRKYCVSYSLPHATTSFITLVEYYCGFTPQEGGLQIV